MSKYQFTPQALGDLSHIWSFVARDNSEAANRVEAPFFGRAIFWQSRSWRDKSGPI
jgi:plasmid stabilization system protein ParE